MDSSAVTLFNYPWWSGIESATIAVLSLNSLKIPLIALLSSANLFLLPTIIVLLPAVTVIVVTGIGVRPRVGGNRRDILVRATTAVRNRTPRIARVTGVSGGVASAWIVSIGRRVVIAPSIDLKSASSHRDAVVADVEAQTRQGQTEGGAAMMVMMLSHGSFAGQAQAGKNHSDQDSDFRIVFHYFFLVESHQKCFPLTLCL